MKNKIKIYVICHNSNDIKKIKEDGTYVPLFVGCDGRDNFGFLSDDSGENISYKNPFYSELTGLYWMWKNSDAAVLGLVHYRRYFSNWAFNHILNKEDCEKILKDYDIVLPEKNKVFLDNLYEEYGHWHHIEDLELCGELIKEEYPDYHESFEKVMNGNEMYCFNMFIAPKKIMDSYCSWLFSILFEFEKKNSYVDFYDDYQKRIYGFLAERLFNVWLDKHDLKIKECEVKLLSIRFNFVRSLLRKLIVNISPLRKFFVKYIMNKLF